MYAAPRRIRAPSSEEASHFIRPWREAMPLLAERSRPNCRCKLGLLERRWARLSGRRGHRYISRDMFLILQLAAARDARFFAAVNAVRAYFLARISKGGFDTSS